MTEAEIWIRQGDTNYNYAFRVQTERLDPAMVRSTEAAMHLVHLITTTLNSSSISKSRGKREIILLSVLDLITKTLQEALKFRGIWIEIDCMCLYFLTWQVAG